MADATKRKNKAALKALDELNRHRKGMKPAKIPSEDLIREMRDK